MTTTIAPLDQFGINLIDKVKNKGIDGAFGRHAEVERTVQILLRRQKSNPILVGKAGVGKTAVVEELVKRIVRCEAHDLNDAVVYELDITQIIAGTRERGETEKRMKELLDDIQSRSNIVLFIDEIHNILGAGKASADSNLTVANLLKPALSRNTLRCIGCTTLDEYTEVFQEDPALDRRFMPVYINEPNEQDTIGILHNIKNVYERYHNCVYEDDAVKSCVQLSQRYIHYRNLPDKAIDLMDEVGSARAVENVKRFRKNKIITKYDVMDFLSVYLKIPIDKLNQTNIDKIKDLEYFMKDSIVGQDPAIHSICQCLMRKECGLAATNRPLASFLFYGASGVGKTQLAKLLGEHYMDDIHILDMSEYMESISVSKLIGAPPGYEGYDEGGRLTNAIKKNPYSVVLFDEIEKAHHSVWNILLQILEDGRLSDSSGNDYNFSHCIVILTSNVGASKKNPIGLFHESAIDDNDHDDLKQVFRPELLNRFDNIVKFNDITSKEMNVIAKKQLQMRLKDLALEGYGAYISQIDILSLLYSVIHESDSPRSVRTTIERLLVDPIVEKSLTATDVKIV